MSISNEEKVVPVHLTGSVRIAIRFLALIALCASLYFAKGFVMPVAFAIVLALTMSPLVRFAEKWRVPPILTAIFLMLAITGIIISSAMTLATPLAELVEDAPRLGAELKVKLRDLREPVETLNKAGDEAGKLANGESSPQEVVIKPPSLVTRAADDFLSIVANMALTLVLTFFLLISRHLFMTKVIRVLPTLSDKKKALAVANDIEKDVSRYLITVTVINSCLGVAVGTAFWMLGMPTPLLFGVLAALLNFLPYVGAAIGIVVTAGVAIISFDMIGDAFLVPAAYLILTVLEGQFVTPAVLGRRFSLNIVVILLSIGFWGFIWGPVGVLLAVPILIIFKAFCERARGFENIAEFLSGEEPAPASDDD